MAATKTEHKTALLLSPHRLQTDSIILESLHINKSANGMQFTNHDLDATELSAFYAALPAQAKEILRGFGKKGIGLANDEIRKRFELQRSGQAFEPWYKNAMARRLHEKLEQLKPFAGIIKWYHKIAADKGHFRTAPCTFSSFRPQLQFDVVKNGPVLALHTFIAVNGTPYPIERFNRHQFMLESSNEYFLLTYKDYQALEWLRDNNPAQYGAQPQAFATHILSKLEEDYTVNRNNLLEKNEIKTAPINRVYLSEISKSFLMLTPQWIYEGLPPIDGPYKPVHEANVNGEAFIVHRDKEVETAFIQLLESLHPNFARQMNGYFHVSFDEAKKQQWFLKVYHRLLELDIQLVGMDMLEHFRYSPHKLVCETVIKKEEDDAIILKMKVSFGKEDVPLAELQKMVLAGQRSILLKDGSLGILNDEWLQQYGAVIRHGKITKSEVRVARWLAFSEQQAGPDSEVLRPVLQQSWWQKWQLWQQSADPVYEVPATVQASLRPYQQKGFEWMLLLAEAGAGACLADDMGLGKTLQTICFIARQLQEYPHRQHVIICPSSLIYNWQQELQKFAPSVSVLVYHGGTRKAAELENKANQVIVTSYNTVRSDVEHMSTLAFGTIILDESHNIKNPAAQITRAVGQLQAATRIALSGTPVMNNTFDLFAQLNFLLPGIFGSREFFKREYADAIDRDHHPEKIKALQKLTAPFVLRRTKAQVAADLPSKTEMVMWCDMSAEQKQLYDEIKNSIRSSVFLNIKSEGLNKSKLALLQGMLKLRQVCNSPLLLPAHEQTCEASVKTDLLMNELANNLANHKVLVFSQFTSMLDLLAKACTEQGIAFYHFDGQTPPHRRAEMVAQFQEAGNTTNVFLISLKAGNAGLNLTAADYVFLFDPWWNTAVQQQAIDRTHRIGQTKNVFAYKMICKDTIEEKIIVLQQRKKQLAENLVSEDEGFVKSLTEEDIEYLFS
jgi:SNF2 family DNA or RNA helicase